MSRLTQSERNQIISDYKHGIANEDYRVIDRGDGTYQVRKRTSKFKVPKQQQKQEEQEPQPKEEPKPEPDRLTNEDLLRKLSYLLKIPEQQVEETPQEFEQEEDAYEQTQQYFDRYAESQNQALQYNAPPISPYRRRPLRLY